MGPSERRGQLACDERPGEQDHQLDELAGPPDSEGAHRRDKEKVIKESSDDAAYDGGPSSPSGSKPQDQEQVQRGQSLHGREQTDQSDGGSDPDQPTGA